MKWGCAAGAVTTALAFSSPAVADSGCGVERAQVKHLTDGFVLPTKARVMTPAQLLALTAPHIGPSTPRLPQERVKVELRNVHVIAVKQEADSDLHVIIQAANGGELNVESPMARCDSTSPNAAILAAARAALDKAFPHPSSSGYTSVNVHATIRGVLFWDLPHGQRGAPNAVELHPVTMFKETP